MRFDICLLSCALLCCIVSFGASGQDAQGDPTQPQSAPGPQQQQQAPAPTGHITGKVFCGDTHRPARGAMVMVIPAAQKGKERGGNAKMSRVAMDGSYYADHLAAGEYVVIGFLPGYLSPFDGLTAGEMRNNPDVLTAQLAQSATVSLSGGGSARFDLTLERGAAVSGRVLYSDGSPATQVTMDVEDIGKDPVPTDTAEDRVNAGRMMRSMLNHQTMNTDDQGRFRISGLPSGKYRVAAVQPSIEPKNDGEALGMLVWGISDPRALHVYSGDTLHKKDAKVYDLRAGDEITDVTVMVPVDAFHTVRGTVTAKDGRPLNMGSLTLTDTADDSLVFRAELQRDGSFAFPTVPSGSYTLAASQARIGKVQDGWPGGALTEYAPMQATEAFANGNAGVMVKDSDVTDVVLALDATAMPKNAQMPSGLGQVSQ